MSLDHLTSLLLTPWAVCLVAFFFGASIFVHELGHFVAARKRGLLVERFSIGFGPKLFGWTRGGVEYRISLIPLGGYVALPQLADLRGLEGESEQPTESLPPITFTDKVVVASMGAVFNILFAFLLGSLLWVAGEYTDYSNRTTTIGYILPEVDTRDGSTIASPASQAGLLPGDEIHSVDGRPVHNWPTLTYHILTGTGRTPEGQPRTLLNIKRGGQPVQVEVFPVLAGPDGVRRIGIIPRDLLIVGHLYDQSPAIRAGLKLDDELIAINGQPLFSSYAFEKYLEAGAAQPLQLTVRRGEETLQVSLTPQNVQKNSDGEVGPDPGFRFRQKPWLNHQTPWSRLGENLALSWRVLASLIHHHSDVGFNKLSGPIGISYVLFKSAMADWRYLLAITVLINVNLALVNLLPIPVLDGGHIVFACLARLRRRALPARFIAATQGAFIAMLLSLVVYVSYFDVVRVGRNEREENRFGERVRKSLEPDFSAPLPAPARQAAEPTPAG